MIELDLLPYLEYLSQDTLLVSHSELGFHSEESAKFWRDKSCGIACVSMLLKAVDGRDLRLGDGIRRMVDAGYYIAGIGWSHKGLAVLMNECGLNARSLRNQSVSVLENQLEAGNAAILSVNAGVHATPRRRRSRRGGHLVLCHGYSKGKPEEACRAFVISDPDYSLEEHNRTREVARSELDDAWNGSCVVCRVTEGRWQEGRQP